ncbi:MAG: hypothetical protein HC837_07820 [Chloroflexaceae bacterium]|nr:hypothetical protein [Chloroflexaceae bacterium]
MFWYDLRNDIYPGTPYNAPVYNPHEVELHFGLLRRTYPLSITDPTLRKPALAAYRAMTEILSGLVMQPSGLTMPDASGMYHYQFAGPDRRVDVLWNMGDGPRILTLACQCQQVLVRAWDGATLALLRSDNGAITVTLPAGGIPLYVVYDPPARLDGSGEWFEATGYTLQGAFQSYWQANGGMAQFGYPITPEVIESEAGSLFPRVVQYVERGRLERAGFVHERGNPASPVQLARLGDLVLQQQGIDWTTRPRPGAVGADCRLFGATGHQLCPPFRAFWEQRGNGDEQKAIELIGLPITEPFDATDAATGTSYRVQYFERARLEFFSVYQGTPYEMQFGLLGREYLAGTGLQP